MGFAWQHITCPSFRRIARRGARQCEKKYCAETSGRSTALLANFSDRNATALSLFIHATVFKN
jgi:hypothetical protein